MAEGLANARRFRPQVLQVRELLTGRGFSYCDADDAYVAADKDAWLATEDKAEAEVARCGSLIAAAEDASTTDHEQQAPEYVLYDNPEFWSSSGSSHPESSDWLLFRLRHPCSRVRALRIAVYRATYQFGEPLYPPKSVSIAVGPSPQLLSPAVVMAPVWLTEAHQTFLLPVDAPGGRYLKVTLHGKRQEQLEDRRYYVAIRHVAAYGHQLTTSQMRALRWASASPSMHLRDGFGLPATAALKECFGMPPRHLATGRQARGVEGSIQLLDDAPGRQQQQQPVSVSGLASASGPSSSLSAKNGSGLLQQLLPFVARRHRAAAAAAAGTPPIQPGQRSAAAEPCVMAAAHAGGGNGGVWQPPPAGGSMFAAVHEEGHPPGAASAAAGAAGSVRQQQQQQGRAPLRSAHGFVWHDVQPRAKEKGEEEKEEENDPAPG